MDENEIKAMINQDDFSSNFIGVFSRTRIPITNSFPAGYIINLDNFGSPGFHWIAVYVSIKYIYIFDSFGRNFLNDPFISAFLRSFANQRIFVSSPYILQHHNSSTCGLYCILFILILSRGYSFNQFISMFNLKRTKCNDLAVVSYFEEKHKRKFLHLLHD